MFFRDTPTNNAIIYSLFAFRFDNSIEAAIDHIFFLLILMPRRDDSSLSLQQVTVSLSEEILFFAPTRDLRGGRKSSTPHTETLSCSSKVSCLLRQRLLL